MIEVSKKDYQNENEVRWCPGCGDYAILATVQKTLAELALPRDETVFVSGIGCAARFPYYMNTYGLHTIHGRAPAIASGVKVANPSLNVFLVTGDGDGLSIGASHLMHLFRRNINIKVLLFNNQIYGLTKGQYSPTSLRGQKAKSSPFGSLEEPINPITFALSAQASFVARSIDNDAQHLGEMLKAAIAHPGASFIEILQSCVVFNDSAFEHIRDKKKRQENALFLKEDAPMLFADGSKGIALDHDSLMPKIVAGDSPEVLRHCPKKAGQMPYVLSSMTWPDFPLPLGIFRRAQRPILEELKAEQDQRIISEASDIDLRKLLKGSNSWEL
jgi:2-oxoglutarate ferredoxin oxidoreductase subunit beta